MSLIFEMMRTDSATGSVTNVDMTPFNSYQESVCDSTDLEAMYERMIMKILESFSTYLKKGSGWMLKRVVRLDITVSKNKPAKGSSHIPLPKELRRKNTLINMKNDDNLCFKWAITRALYPKDNHPERVSKDLREKSRRTQLGRHRISNTVFGESLQEIRMI